MKLFKRIFVITLVSTPLLVGATELDRAASIEADTLRAATVSQKRIDASDENTQQMKAEIERLQQEIENLKVYRHHLQNLVIDQDQEKDRLHQQLEDIKQTRQGIVPLMYLMIDALDSWVESDLPIKHDRRQQRVAGLLSMMSLADVSDAEKFRRILEAYQIELDYGAKLGVYQEKMTLDGVIRDVDVLHLGRLSLVAKSLDGSAFWYFDRPHSAWVPVSAEGRDIDRDKLHLAYQVANKNAAPTLLSLPLSLTEPSQPAAQK
ncbi:hypothetical protein A1OO_11315 [Enterovibrio norvegicus FF-33]|uniref:DUF3450 domain-containing protein n=1 Tax=Enterovibrio TaxID=188143 RepID=UPI0002FC640B|nr:DUF3450 domain-containing protein [Enterovibrio norvegicus]OEE66366.1 hypothetical protein A1OO_11315 [Enterovibrio norvegicus FF-33]